MPRPEREEFRVDGLNEPISHYTDAVRFGDLLFVSGIAPVDEHLNLVGGDDVGAQTRRLFENMDRILQTAGASFGDILKVTVYLTDVNDRQAVDVVRREFFGDARPASTLIGVAQLVVPGMKVEIDAVAGLRS